MDRKRTNFRKCIYPNCGSIAIGYINSHLGAYHFCEKHRDEVNYDMMLLPMIYTPDRYVNQKDRFFLKKKYGITIIPTKKLKKDDCFVVTGSDLDAPFDKFLIAICTSNDGKSIGWKEIEPRYKNNTIGPNPMDVSNIAYERKSNKKFFKYGFAEVVGTRKNITFEFWRSKVIKDSIFDNYYEKA